MRLPRLATGLFAMGLFANIVIAAALGTALFLQHRTAVRLEAALLRGIRHAEDETARLRQEVAKVREADEERANLLNSEVFARYYPGIAFQKAWKATIRGNGKVVQEIFDPRKLEKPTRDPLTTKEPCPLTQEDLKQLFATAKVAKFFDLRAKYNYGIDHSNALLLRLSFNGTTHEVVISAPDFKENRSREEIEGIRRFLLVWDEVLRKVPPPDP
jgi:hypothetical protein